MCEASGPGGVGQWAREGKQASVWPTFHESPAGFTWLHRAAGRTGQRRSRHSNRTEQQNRTEHSHGTEQHERTQPRNRTTEQNSHRTEQSQNTETEENTATEVEAPGSRLGLVLLWPGFGPFIPDLALGFPAYLALITWDSTIGSRSWRNLLDKRWNIFGLQKKAQ